MTEAEYRKILKKNHICRDCRKQDAYTLAGRTYCADCADKMSLKKRIERQKDGGTKNSESCKRYREKAEIEHKCRVCGRALPKDHKYKTCTFCLAKHRKLLRDKRASMGVPTWGMRVSGEYCFQCVKNPPMEGKKLCKDCYDKKLKICLPSLEKFGHLGREIWKETW